MLDSSNELFVCSTNTTHAFTQRDKANSPLRDLALRTVQERRKRALRSYLKIQVCFLEKKKNPNLSDTLFSQRSQTQTTPWLMIANVSSKCLIPDLIAVPE